MGGIVIIFATLISALLWMDLNSRHFYTLLAVALSFGLVGFYDDFLKITKKNHNGLSSRYKFLALTIFSLGIVLWHLWSSENLVAPESRGAPATLLFVPFLKSFAYLFRFTFCL